ncbi:MAG: response regulator [Nitrospinae bacterium]|nr:response regulator [Nitrospinota bacterium]
MRLLKTMVERYMQKVRLERGLFSKLLFQKAEESSMKDKSILIVDDEKLIVETMCDDLRNEGYQVDFAYDGNRGLDMFKINRYNLVITDLEMRGMGGNELAQKIKEIDSEVKVVILTGYGTRESAIESLRLKVDDFFLKPYERKDLLEKVADLMVSQASDGVAQDTSRLLKEWGLSDREIEVGKLMLVGTTKEEIASLLFISKLTVNTHIKNMYKKLKVNSLSKFIGKVREHSQ